MLVQLIVAACPLQEGKSAARVRVRLQELFDVDPHAGYPWLGAAATSTDLAALFKPGTLR